VSQVRVESALRLESGRALGPAHARWSGSATVGNVRLPCCVPGRARNRAARAQEPEHSSALPRFRATQVDHAEHCAVRAVVFCGNCDACATRATAGSRQNGPAEWGSRRCAQPARLLGSNTPDGRAARFGTGRQDGPCPVCFAR